MKSVQIRSFFCSVFSRIQAEYGKMLVDAPYLSVFSPNAGKYGPKKTSYLDTFHTVALRVIKINNYTVTHNSASAKALVKHLFCLILFLFFETQNLCERSNIKIRNDLILATAEVSVSIQFRQYFTLH